jgi:hypothetical protein
MANKSPTHFPFLDGPLGGKFQQDQSGWPSALRNSQTAEVRNVQ